VSTNSSILVGTADKVVWIKVEGKGSFLNSALVKNFAMKMVDRGHSEFVVDLKNCPVMDSTFMGTLTMIAQRLRNCGCGPGRLRLVNLNERNHDLLTNLGLAPLFVMAAQNGSGASVPDNAQPAEPLAQEDAGKSSQAQTMLDAHQALVAANPENLTKFKDVLEYLKQDLQNGPE
jgi:anti-sigma B factor antagonist